MIKNRLGEKLLKLASGENKPETRSEELFMYSYTAGQKKVSYSDILMALPGELENHTKDELLYIIAGYALSELESKYGILVNINEH